MNLLDKLASIADILDSNGHIVEAYQIDTLIKEAIDIADKLVKDRFWSKVDKTPKCWQWNGAVDSSGYGICTIGGKNYSTHRLSWQWANGKAVPKGLVLLHKCDEPRCCKPGHLILGTGNENVADRVKKNRSARGKGNGRARLTERDVKKIKKLRQKGWTEKGIALLYGVGRSTISHILRGNTWSWLD